MCIDKIFAAIERGFPKYLDFLCDICAFEAKAEDKQTINKMIDHIAAFALAEGFCATRTAMEQCGDFLSLDLNEGAEKCCVFMAHTDTVHEKGIFGEKSVTRLQDRIIAPGAIDCKGGIAIALLTMKVLKEHGYTKLLRLLLTSDEEISNLQHMEDPETLSVLIGILVAIFSVALVIGLVLGLIGSIIGLGYNRFNLNLIDREEEKISQLVSYFPHWKNAICLALLRFLYVFLWSLLFIIPGIIAAYNYSMSSYILTENPDMSASEALRRSKEMMDGNKWRLFCLEMSFIGWAFLCGLTMGIGYLWLLPYEKAAFTDFYREISGTRKVVEIPEEPTPEIAEA